MRFIDGRWYLLFSCSPHMISDALKERFPNHTFTPSVYSMVSDRQWGPYRLHGTGLVQLDEAPARVYAGQMVRWRNRWYVMGFQLTPELRAGEVIADPVEVQATPEGIKEIRRDAAPNANRHLRKRRLRRAPRRNSRGAV